MLPSHNGQTRPLVVDSLQLISIYSIYSLILSPRSDQRDAETIVISSYNISRRQRRCSLVSKCYQQPQLLINFVLISAPMFSRPNYSAFDSHPNVHILYPALLGSHCNAPSALLSFQIITIIHFHFTCSALYIICPACVCNGVA